MLKTFKGVLIFSTLISIILILPFQGVVSGAEYPTKPITFSLGSGAGGTTDQSGRALAKAMERYLGQKVVVVNKPGSSGVLNVASLAKAKPDGYRVATINSPASILVPNMQDLPYDPINGLTYIGQYGAFQLGLCVRSDAPWKTFKELVDYIKKNPGVAVIGGGLGKATPQYLALHALSEKLDLKYNYVIFPGGSSKVIAAGLGGHVKIISEPAIPYVRSGDFRFLLTFNEKRPPQFPDVPTLKELYGISAFTLLGMVGPPGLPEPIQKKLENALRKAIDDPEFRKVMTRLNMPVIWRSGEDFRKHIEKSSVDARKWLLEMGLAKKK